MPLLIVAEQGSSWGWGSGTALACYLIGAGRAGRRSCSWSGATATRRCCRCGCSSGRTFSVAVSSSFLIGMAMFGGLLLLPLYLQVVEGASPTRAGLELLPLVLGMMVGSIAAGQTITPHRAVQDLPDHRRRADHRRAMLLFSRLTADTSCPR